MSGIQEPQEPQEPQINSVVLVKWRVYCMTEDKWTYGWLNPDITPTRCFHNNEHNINENSYQDVDRVTVNNTMIIEEEIRTGGFFRSQGFSFIIPPNTVRNKDISWKYPVSVLTSKIQTSGDDIGNTMEAVVGPDTIIGFLLNNNVPGSNVLKVSDTVLQNVYNGIEILINGVLIGEVMSIGVDEIILCEPITEEFLAGSLIGGQRRIIKNFNLGFIQGCDIGQSKIGATYVPAGTITRVYYHNNKDIEKTFHFNIEYLY